MSPDNKAYGGRKKKSSVIAHMSGYMAFFM
jgi:hypothetical protein